MASRHLVSLCYLPGVGNPDPDQLVYAGRKLVLVVPGELFDVNYLPLLAVGDTQAGVLNFPGLLTEDRSQQLLFRRELRFTLGRYLADQDVSGPDNRPNPDDSFLVQVGQAFFANIRDVLGDLLGAKFRVPGLHLVLLNMNRGELVLPDYPFAYYNGVFVVVAFPAHKGTQDVLSQRQLSHVGRGAVGQDLASAYPVSLLHNRPLVYAGALVAPHELEQGVFPQTALVLLDHDFIAGNRDHLAVRRSHTHLTTVLGNVGLHSSPDQGRLGAEEGHGLPLHVGSHQRPVGVVVLQERDQGS